MLPGRRASPHPRLQEGRPRHLRRADGSLLRKPVDSPSTTAPPWWCRPYPPIVNGAPEERMWVGCGSATIGMFAKQWHGKVDEVVVVDDDITGVLSKHRPAGCWIFATSGSRWRAGAHSGRLFRSPSPAPAGAAPEFPIRFRCWVRSTRRRRARDDDADGLDHRRARGLFRARRGVEPDEKPMPAG